MRCMRRPEGGSRSCESLLRELQTLDFALYDVALYLDGHPDDRRAMAYYEQVRDQAAELTARYEASCGPLQKNRVMGETWTWVRDPWPWETEDAPVCSPAARGARGAR